MPKTGRNETCWCGSGLKHKNCHLGRADESPLPLRAIAGEARRAGAFRTCLHPDASSQTCSTIISAHTLQRSRVLSEIADSSKHVLTFFPAELADTGRLRVHRSGWKRSATFSAFCGKHDDETFAPLEKVAFEGTPEQKFLIAYRAVCWELYQKRSIIKASPVVRKQIDRGMTESVQRDIQEVLSVQDEGFRKGLSDLEKLKTEMDTALSAKAFDILQTVELALEGPLGIASTGVITPNRTLSGKQLQKLHDPNAHLQALAFGVDIRAEGPSAIFAWLRGHSTPSQYMDEVLALPPDLRASFLAQFYFAHCENTYFAETWWDSLDAHQRQRVEGLSRNSNPYYYPPKYDLADQKLAPWTSAYIGQGKTPR